MVPLTVRFGDEDCPTTSISARAFYGGSRAPAAAAHGRAAPVAFAEAYRELLERAVSSTCSRCISPGALGDGQLRAAGGRGVRRTVTVIDTRTASTALRSARWGSRGGSTKGPASLTISSADAEGFPAARASSSRSRRSSSSSATGVSAGQALVGGLLGVRPLLTLVEGEVVPLGRVRGACAPARGARAVRVRGHAGRRAAARRHRPRPGRDDRERSPSACAACARAPRSSLWCRWAPWWGRTPARAARARVGARARRTASAALRAPLRRAPRLLAGLQIAALVIAARPFLASSSAMLCTRRWPPCDTPTSSSSCSRVLIAAYYLVFVFGWQAILRHSGIRPATPRRWRRDALDAREVHPGRRLDAGGAGRRGAPRRHQDTSLVLASIALEAGLSAIAGVIVLAVGLPFVGPAWTHDLAPSPSPFSSSPASAGLRAARRARCAVRRRPDEPLPWPTRDRRTARLLLPDLGARRRRAAASSSLGRRSRRSVRSRSSAGPARSARSSPCVSVIFARRARRARGAVGALCSRSRRAPSSARSSSTASRSRVEALLLLVAAILSRGRRHSYPAPE